MDESELERKAVEELLKETSRAKVRAETMGATGWMKCPLGSPNKRFLLNTLGSAAVTDQPTNQRASERDEHRYKRACDKHRNTDCEKCNPKKDFSHRRYHSDSHSHTSNHRSSSRNHSPSRRRHSPHLSRKSKRTRSRSPVQDSSPDVKKYTDRGGKWCNTLFVAFVLSTHEISTCPMNAYNNMKAFCTFPFPFALYCWRIILKIEFLTTNN